MKHYISKEDKDRAVSSYMNQHLSFMVDKVTDKMMIILHKSEENRTWIVNNDSDADKIEQEIRQDVKQYLNKLESNRNGKDR